MTWKRNWPGVSSSVSPLKSAAKRHEAQRQIEGVLLEALHQGLPLVLGHGNPRGRQIVGHDRDAGRARQAQRIEAADQVVEAIFAAATERTRLLVVSHITSPTAITLPVEPIVAEAKRRGMLVCVDGPHAVAQLPLDLERLACDFYCASCHKWLSAPFGSGFLYVAPQHHALIRTPILSWGRLPPTRLDAWSDEFIWSGTRDPSPYLAIPAAIERYEQESARLVSVLERQLRDSAFLAGDEVSIADVAHFGWIDGAEGYAGALNRIFEVARNIDSQTVTLQYFETLKSMAASPATKYIFPLEFTGLISDFVAKNKSLE